MRRNRVKRKLLVTSPESGKSTTLLLAFFVPEVEIFKSKNITRTLVRASAALRIYARQSFLLSAMRSLAAITAMRAAPAAIVRKAGVRAGRPACDHKKDIQDEQPDRNIVKQRRFGEAGPELVRRPEQKRCREQDRLGQFRRRASMGQLKNHVSAGDRRQGKGCESIVAPRGKKARSSIVNQEQRNAGKGCDAHHQRKQPAIAVIPGLHNSLFPGA